MALSMITVASLLVVALSIAGSVSARNMKTMQVDFSGYCSDESIPTGSTYWTSLNQTLTDLIQNTPVAKNMTYSVKNGGDDVSAYGQAQCINLSSDACKGCLEEMVRRAWQECGDAIAAMLMLKDKCSIRYQDSPL